MSMAKYHINSQGVPAVCRARAGNCPFGGNEQHFSNVEEAQDFADKMNEDKYGIFKNVESGVVYEIPEGTPGLSKIDKDKFIHQNYKLVKSGETWVHLDDHDNVIGTMKNPIAIYDNDGELVEIADVDNYANKMSVQGIKALKTLSKFNLVSKELMEATKSIHFYSPKEDLDEYKEVSEQERISAERKSLEAFRMRVQEKGGNRTAELFSNPTSDDKMTNYFTSVENERLRKAKENQAYIKPEIIDYKPERDNWEELPSARDFPLKEWKENNLDVQKINKNWAVVDDKGNLYGKLDNPAVVVNFETETIESIGEHEDVHHYCIQAKEESSLLEGSPSPLDKIGAIKMNDKNNNLGKIRSFLKFAWAFRENPESD